jgi:hypothetical protein
MSTIYGQGFVADLGQIRREQIEAEEKLLLAGLPPELLRQKPGQRATLTDEQIEAVAREHFCKALDEKEGDWGPNTLNAAWLKDIGIPFARAILAAASRP